MHVCLPPPVLLPLVHLLRRLGRIVVADVHDLAPELFELRYAGEGQPGTIRVGSGAVGSP